jgi:hypothetical protein
VATNNERISAALDLLTEGLAPYTEDRLKTIYRENWARTAKGSFRDDRNRSNANGDGIAWDAHSLLTVMWDQWNSVFRHQLGHTERSLVSELREFRNRWAHQEEFDFDDTYRVVDSVRRLLQAAGSDKVEDVNRIKQELLESHVAEQVNSQIQRTAFQRNKWWVIGIYTLCCGLIIGHMFFSEHRGAPAVASFTVLLLVYLIYQQFKMEPPLLYGPRECLRCHKIVYRRTCPYCDSVN